MNVHLNVLLIACHHIDVSFEQIVLPTLLTSLFRALTVQIGRFVPFRGFVRCQLFEFLHVWHSFRGVLYRCLFSGDSSDFRLA